MKKLKKNQLNALFICLLPLIGIIISYFTDYFRMHQQLRFIYLIGVALRYLSWIMSLVLGITNSQSIFLNKNYKISFKILWSTISLLPILYFVVMFIIITLSDPLKEDKVLPSGEHISKEYK